MLKKSHIKVSCPLIKTHKSVKLHQAGNRETNDNQDTEIQRKGDSEKKRNLESEKPKPQTNQMIPTMTVIVSTISDAVSLSLKQRIGENTVFVFCRALKAFQKTNKCELSKTDLDDAFSQWWSAARPHLPQEADFEEYLFDFRYTFKRARIPLGANPLTEAILRAKTYPPPLQGSGYENPKLKQLIAVCYQLQLLSGDKPFFLSLRGAERVLEMEGLKRAMAIMEGLVTDGVLIIVAKGVPGKPSASRYKFNSLSPIKS